MKKRIRKTGEIVDVIGFRADKGKERDWEDYVHYKTSDTIVKGINGLNLYQDFDDVEEWLTKEIDWEQVRIDAAIAALNGFCSNSQTTRLSAGSLSISCVEAADALIAELKKGGKDENNKE